jgi:hypothetical protein
VCEDHGTDICYDQRDRSEGESMSAWNIEAKEERQKLQIKIYGHLQQKEWVIDWVNSKLQGQVQWLQQTDLKDAKRTLEKYSVWQVKFTTTSHWVSYGTFKTWLWNSCHSSFFF